VGDALVLLEDDDDDQDEGCVVDTTGTGGTTIPPKLELVVGIIVCGIIS
jgi:hypothetical protein